MKVNYETDSDMHELGGDAEFILLEGNIKFDSFSTVGSTGHTILDISGVTPPWYGTEDEQKFLERMKSYGHTLSPTH